MKKRQKTTSALLITIFLLMVISFWLITLNLSFKNQSPSFNRDGLSFEEFRQSVKDIFAKSPLSTRNTKSTTNNTNNVINKLTEKVEEELENTEIEIDMSNWQTYRNEEYGFEFKYPGDWAIDNLKSSEQTIVFNTQNNVPETRESISFQYSNKTLNEWLKEIDKKSIISTSELTINNKMAKQVNTSEFGIIKIATINNNKFYIIETQGEILKNKILSTFKFLD